MFSSFSILSMFSNVPTVYELPHMAIYLLFINPILRTENPEKRPMVPPTRPRAPSKVKARSYSIWSYVALPMPTINTWRLYGRLRSEKKKTFEWNTSFDLTSFRCVCIKNNVSQFLLLVLQIDLHEILQLWVFSYKLCLISPADIICMCWKFGS